MLGLAYFSRRPLFNRDANMPVGRVSCGTEDERLGARTAVARARCFSGSLDMTLRCRRLRVGPKRCLDSHV